MTKPTNFTVSIKSTNHLPDMIDSSFASRGDAINRAIHLRDTLDRNCTTDHRLRTVIVTNADGVEFYREEHDDKSQNVAEYLGEYGIATDDAPLVNTRLGTDAGQKMIDLHLAADNMLKLIQATGLELPDSIRTDLYDCLLDACGLIELESNRQTRAKANHLHDLPALSR